MSDLMDIVELATELASIASVPTDPVTARLANDALGMCFSV